MMATPLALNACEVSTNEGYRAVFSCGTVYHTESFIEQFFHVMLFIILYKVVLTLQSVDKTLVWPFKRKRVRSNYSTRARLGWTFSYICCILVRSDLDSAPLFAWILERSIAHTFMWHCLLCWMWPFKWKLLSSTLEIMWYCSCQYWTGWL